MKKAGKQIAVMVGILALCMGLAGCSVVKDVAELVRAFGTAVFAMLFLFLWVGTVPGKRTVCSDTGEPRDLGEYTKERKPKRAAKKAKVSVREWVRKNKL